MEPHLSRSCDEAGFSWAVTGLQQGPFLCLLWVCLFPRSVGDGALEGGTQTRCHQAAQSDPLSCCDSAAMTLGRAGSPDADPGSPLPTVACVCHVEFPQEVHHNQGAAASRHEPGRPLPRNLIILRGDTTRPTHRWKQLPGPRPEWGCSRPAAEPEGHPHPRSRSHRCTSPPARASQSQATWPTPLQLTTLAVLV